MKMMATKKKKVFTNEEKMAAIANSPHIIDAVRFLTAAFIDMELNSYLRIGYVMDADESLKHLQGCEFELIFQKTKSQTFK
jgi:hypothetical protein